jgi:hypothetical protein
MKKNITTKEIKDLCNKHKGETFGKLEKGLIIHCFRCSCGFEIEATGKIICPNYVKERQAYGLSRAT